MELEYCKFYCLSYDINKRNEMKQRFKELNIKCHFYGGVQHNDERINKKTYNKSKKRQLSMLYGHLDIIQDFFNSDSKKYAVICEDDIIIHKNIKNILQKVIIDLNILNLDILLLSYMMPYKMDNSGLFVNYKLKRDMPNNSFYKYHDYPKFLLGTQMYIITRQYAKFILENYYSKKNKLNNYLYICDKMIIHNGNKALIYPMLAIENENQEDAYHQLCHKIHYDECYI